MENQTSTQLEQSLLNCAIACEYCATECLKEDDAKNMAHCITLDRDCAEICALAARLLKHNSPVARQCLMLCKEICRTCAGANMNMIITNNTLKNTLPVLKNVLFITNLYARIDNYLSATCTMATLTKQKMTRMQVK